MHARRTVEEQRNNERRNNNQLNGNVSNSHVELPRFQRTSTIPEQMSQPRRQPFAPPVIQRIPFRHRGLSFVLRQLPLNGVQQNIDSIPTPTPEPNLAPSRPPQLLPEANEALSYLRCKAGL